MDNLFLYLFKVSTATILLYLGYIIFFKRDTFHSRNRVLLILILLLPLVVPAVKITVVSESSLAASISVSISNFLMPGEAYVTNLSGSIAQPFNFYRLFKWLYFIVSGLVLLRCAISIMVTLRIIRNGVLKSNQFPKIVTTDLDLSPFSFFPYVIIPNHYNNTESYNEILNHETAHVRQRHTFDLILSELMIAVQWFNPVVWLIKRSIILNHEYLADRVSIKKHNDIREYQFSLLRFNAGLKTISMAHNFNNNIKNRIIMINKKSSTRISAVKNLIMVPLVALITCTQATPEYKNESSTQLSKNLSSSSSPELTQKPYEVVDELPQYPGGEKALMDFIVDNIKYPKEAITKNIQGRVIVRFIVTKEGKTEGSSVISSANPLLDAEALRVIESISGWTPGKVGGKDVNTYFAIPVTFALR
jgi:TonB family protein